MAAKPTFINFRTKSTSGHQCRIKNQQHGYTPLNQFTVSPEQVQCRKQSKVPKIQLHHLAK